jgi:hypothetical protein
MVGKEDRLAAKEHKERKKKREQGQVIRQISLFNPQNLTGRHEIMKYMKLKAKREKFFPFMYFMSSC